MPFRSLVVDKGNDVMMIVLRNPAGFWTLVFHMNPRHVSPPSLGSCDVTSRVPVCPSFWVTNVEPWPYCSRSENQQRQFKDENKSTIFLTEISMVSRTQRTRGPLPPLPIIDWKIQKDYLFRYSFELDTINMMLQLVHTQCWLLNTGINDGQRRIVQQKYIWHT